MASTSSEHVENALIVGTWLGYETHGILSSYLTLELRSGSVQSFGGLNLSSPEELKKFLTGVMDVVGCSSWENVSGQHVRVKFEGGPLSRIIGIGNILKDKWYIPEVLLNNKSTW